MNKGYLLAVVLAAGLSQTATASVAESEAEIRQVVENFRISIINKDKELFTSLFFSENVPFVAVFSDEMLSKKRVEKPSYPAAVDLGQYGPPVTMISDEDSQEEKIWDINVQSDGYLASVHFNYSDHENGKKKAWGTESWSMVKVGADWKITSVSFTVTEVDGAE